MCSSGQSKADMIAHPPDSKEGNARSEADVDSRFIVYVGDLVGQRID